MSEFFEAFQYGFMQRALLVGSLIGICCAFLGIFLVLRRFSLIGDGLAHVSFATIGLGLLLGIYPLYAAVPLTMAGALLILYITEKSNVHGDAAIGLLSAVGVSIGVTLASIGDGFNVDLFSYLFGDILTISKMEAWLATGLSLLIILMTTFFYHDLFALTFDADYAHVQGVNVKTINKILVVLTSITVVISIKVVGTMLVSALIVFPSVTALQISKGFKPAIILAALIAVSSIVLGICISYLMNLPAGAAIVLLNFIFFAIAFTFRRL